MGVKPTPESSLLQRVWGSIQRGPFWPGDDRGRMRRAMNDFVLHIHPPRVSARSLRFTYTFGLGGLAILLLLVQVLTGVLLMFVYKPTPEAAYNSIIFLQTQVWFGQLIRNLHHWSANLLLVVAFLHMLRVFYTAAFRPPREFSWQLGLALLMLVAAANFTGYLLPWDQLSYWAVTVGTSLLHYIPLIGDGLRTLLLGGPEVGAATLSNFYAMHVMLIPLGLFVFMLYHIWRVRKNRFTLPRRPAEDPATITVKMVTSLPHLVGREAVFALVMLALLLAWTTWIDAPLLPAADPLHPPNPTRSAWYFAGLQELLLHFHPTFGAFVIPVIAVGALVALPYRRDNVDSTGVWFRSWRGRPLALLSFIMGALAALGLVLLSERGPDGALSWLPTFISGGLLPLTLIWLALAGYGFLLRRVGLTVGEARMAVFTVVLAALLMLTVIGALWRGPDMILLLPWEAGL